jgi:hypothetical protein
MKKPARFRRRLRREKRSGVRVKAVLNHGVRGGGHYNWYSSGVAPKAA